jgi:hypothetical protein
METALSRQLDREAAEAEAELEHERDVHITVLGETYRAVGRPSEIAMALQDGYPLKLWSGRVLRLSPGAPFLLLYSEAEAPRDIAAAARGFASRAS